MTVVGVFLCIWMGFLWHLLIAMFKPVQSSSSKWGQKFGCCEVYLVVFLNEVSGPEILVVVKCILLFSWMRWVGQFVSGQKADKLMDGVWQAIFQFGCFCFTSVGSLTIFYSRLRKRSLLFMNTFEVAFMHIPGKTNFKFPKKFHKWECSYEMLPLNHVFVFYRLHEVFNLQQSSWLKSQRL